MYNIRVQPDVENHIIHDLTKPYRTGHGGGPAQKDDVPIGGLCEECCNEVHEAEEHVENSEQVEQAKSVGAMSVEAPHVVKRKNYGRAEDQNAC